MVAANSGEKPCSLFLIPAAYVSSEVKSSVSPAQVDLEQDKEGSADEDSGCENSLDQGGVMDFSVAAIAEQLTRIDSVREEIYFIHFYCSTKIKG